MTIRVNGEASDVAPGTTVAELLAALDLPGRDRGIAVAVDADVVPRAEWDAFALTDGCSVEVLNAVQGG